MSEQQSGWYVDPSGRHRLRYWSGTQWSDQVNDGNTNFSDPIEQDKAFVPPAPGTKPAQPVQAPQQQPQNISVQTSQPKNNSMVGILIGGLVIVVLVIALLIALDDDDNGNSGGGGDTPTTQTTGGTPTTAPPTTSAPTTEAPADGG